VDLNVESRRFGDRFDGEYPIMTTEPNLLGKFSRLIREIEQLIRSPFVIPEAPLRIHHADSKAIEIGSKTHYVESAPQNLRADWRHVQRSNRLGMSLGTGRG